MVIVLPLANHGKNSFVLFLKIKEMPLACQLTVPVMNLKNPPSPHPQGKKRRKEK
jgi:hypothetical protein